MTDNRAVSDEKQKSKLEIEEEIRKINTSIPAIVDDFDVETQRVSATPAINVKIVVGNEVKYIRQPKITNIPLGQDKCETTGLWITKPVKAGNNCTLIISQRGIDNFLTQGEIVNPPDTNFPERTTIRCFDLTDAMCFPGVVTNAQTLKDYSQDAVEIRNTAGNTKVSVGVEKVELLQDEGQLLLTPGITLLKQGASMLKMTAESTLWESPKTTMNTDLSLNGELMHMGSVTTTGPVVSEKQGTFAGTGINTHTHLENGPGKETNPPTAGT